MAPISGKLLAGANHEKDDQREALCWAKENLQSQNED